MSWNNTNRGIFLNPVMEFETEEEENNSRQSESDTFYSEDKDSVYYPRETITFGAICMILMSILAILGNFISILALLKSKWLKKITTTFVVNLCVSDFFKSWCILTDYSIVYRTQQWNGVDSTCKFYNIIVFVFIVLSMLTVIAITLNRYVLIVHPQFYHSIFRLRNTAIMIGLLWIISVVRILLRYFKLWGEFAYDRNTGECSPTDHDGNTELYPYFLIYILPLILFILCYAKIFYVVRKAERNTERYKSNIFSYIAHVNNKYWLEESEGESEQTSYKDLRNQKERRLFQMILVIVLCYILCFIPMCVVKLLRKEKEHPNLYIAFHLPLYLSNVVNPVIYIVMSEEYRKAYKDLFRCKAENG